MNKPSSNENNPSDKKPLSTTAGSEPDFMRWEADKMSTGVASIDAQHQELISRINELHRATLTGVSAHDIEKIIVFLGHFAETHFKHEEGLMEELRCPVRAENRVAHAAFLREFRALASHFSLDGDPDEIAVKIKKMAAHWLSSHICRVDLKLRDSTDCVSAPGSGRTA